MPAVLSKAPHSASFSRNAIIAQISSADYFTTAPEQTVIRIDFLAAVTEGSQVSFNWQNGAALLTAKNVPDNSGTQFPTGDGSIQYVESLIDWFIGNYFLSRDYDIVTDGTGAHPALLLTAKNAGQAFNTPAFANVQIALSIAVAGTDGNPKSNFRHHLELWVKKAGDNNYTCAYNENPPLDFPLNGITTIDLQSDLDDFLGADLPVLDNISQVCNSSAGFYFLRFAQFFGAIPTIQKIVQSPVFNINRGGLRIQDALTRTIMSELYPVAGNAGQNCFMRQGSKNIIVLPDQPEWLTWYNLTGQDQNAELEITVTNRDNSNVVFIAAQLDILAGQKVQFQTGYNQLNIPGQLAAGQMASFYCVRLKNAAGYLTAAYNYVLDYQYWEWSKFFVYENSYGAFQTMPTVGKGQGAFDRLKDDAQRVTDPFDVAANGSLLECNIWIQDKGTVAIGYNRANNRTTQLLRSFFASEKVFLFQDEVLMPVGINTKEFKDAPDGENLYAGAFEYFSLIKERGYSEPAGLEDDDLTALLPAVSSPVILIDPSDDYDTIWDNDNENDYGETIIDQ